ncbi:MAG: FkbM family methyltransferase [Deltaproteobacteria bacterium]|nr:FkbM family methyltransferase [Deltaproteobacteria bacterium]
MKPLALAKAAARRALGAPGVRHGLRWFLNQEALPRAWRDRAHRTIAKRATFGPAPFEYSTPEGVRLRFLHSGSSNYLYWRNEYEPESTSVYMRLARRSRVILDIGAAEGVYAILAAAANPDARVLAFEPGSGAAARTRRNIELNLPLTRNVELHDVALGDEDGEATLYVAGETGGTSSLNPEFRSERREQRVSVHTADSFLAKLAIDRVDLVKIDTESTEPAVLRGLRKRLHSDRPDVICEVLRGRTERALEEILAPLSYRYYWLSDRGPVRRERLEGDPTYRHLNFLFSARPEDELLASLREATASP